MNSKMKEMKQRLDTLTASLEESKDEGQLWDRFKLLLSSELPLVSVSKRVLLLTHSYENAFPLQLHFHANKTLFL